jgi:hypothetical protein
MLAKSGKGGGAALGTSAKRGGARPGETGGRLHDDADPLYLAALALERDERLNAETAVWDAAIGDGLNAR